jgi:malic enzyme
LLAARRARGGVTGDRFLFLGAGAAAIGIARLLRLELEAAGIDEASIASRIALMDRAGLVHLGRDAIADDQVPFAVLPGPLTAAGGDAALVDPVEVARAFRPTVLVGTTGCGGAFTEALVREVAANDEAPIILPLSNPGDRAEATPEQILAWTEGRAIVATGGPRPPVEIGGRRRLIGQANNVFVFPGVGLGAIVAGVSMIDEGTFLVAAHRLAELVRGDRLATGAVYPPVADLRHVAREVAVAVARHLRDAVGGTVLVGESDEAIELAVDAAMWEPAYRRYLAG